MINNSNNNAVHNNYEIHQAISSSTPVEHPNLKSYCYSLPSRRMKKARAVTNGGNNSGNNVSNSSGNANNMVMAKSASNLTQAMINEEEALVQEVSQKLNALLLYKYQHSKASRELAEVRQALSNLQQQSSSTNNLALYGKRPGATSTTGIPAMGISSMGRAGRHHHTGPGNRNSTSSGKSDRAEREGRERETDEMGGTA